MKAGVGLLLAGALVAAACGTPGGLPDPGPCPATITALQGTPDRGLYIAAVIAALDEFQDADQDFRAAWPDREIHTTNSFRKDFVEFQRRTECLSNDVVAAGTPAGLETVVTDLHAYLALINESIAMGAQAVESRNSSAYSDWIKEIDVLVVGYTDYQARLLEGR
jgi:hypothetical protein